MNLFRYTFLFMSVFLFSNLLDASQSKSVYIEDDALGGNKKRELRKRGCGYDKPIRVAGFVTNPPFGWATMVKSGKSGNEYVPTNNGYAIDLFFNIAKKFNLNVRNVGYTSYQAALKDLQYGRIDVVAGVYYNKYNMGVGTNLLYPSFMDNPIIVVFLKGKEKDVSSFNDLKNLKGVVRQEEFIYPLIFRQLNKDIYLEQVSGSKKAFQKLIDGEVDYILTSLYAAEAEIRRFKLLGKVTYIEKSLLKPQLFFAFSSVSPCQNLKNMFSSELRKQQENQDEYHKKFIEYIDKWGMDFKDEPGLVPTSLKKDNDVASNSDTSDKNDIYVNDVDTKANEEDLKKDL